MREWMRLEGMVLTMDFNGTDHSQIRGCLTFRPDQFAFPFESFTVPLPA